MSVHRTLYLSTALFTSFLMNLFITMSFDDPYSNDYFLDQLPYSLSLLMSLCYTVVLTLCHSEAAVTLTLPVLLVHLLSHLFSESISVQRLPE